MGIFNKNQQSYEPYSYPTEAPSDRSSTIKSVASTALLFALAPLLAVLINMFIFQSYEVKGSSMEPTLHNNDRLIILKLPRTWSALTRHPLIPPRGTIVVFKKPGTEYEQLIKRVIGLPGERVVVKNGKVTVFNKDHTKGFDPSADTDWGKSLYQITEGSVDVIVNEGEIFVLGDNRLPGASLDSRSYLGNISSHEIVGELSLRILPVTQAKSF